jgi:redox-sensitive bicupin YhaK (pirin superfamily)
MSWNPAFEPGCPDAVGLDAIETLIIPRARDIGGFEVRRALPAPKRQMVGPFIFFDEMGPAEFIAGAGIDVRPHPHIGLATVTYLFRGELQHRDSIGSNQIIHPGAVNWMVAGRGVVHSERTSAETRKNPHSDFGIQTWVALPEAQEDKGPLFEHHAMEALPVIESGGARVRVILGNAYGAEAPASVFSETFYADAELEPFARMPLPDDHEDRGLHIVEGSISVAGQTFEKGRMMVFRPGDKISVAAGPAGARLILLGGATLSGPRYISWNFVSSSREKIEAAKAAWRKGDWGKGPFDLPPDDREEFIPLPEGLA